VRYLFIIVLIFLSCSGNHPALKIKGSDTEVNLVVELAEAFHYANPNAYLSVSGGGSGLGIASLLNSQADIANSSRELNEEERDLFKKRGIAIDTFIFAEDAIAFIVSNNLPLDSLNLHDLSRILDGTYANWSAVCGKNMEINIYGRQSNSGTHEFLKKKLGISFTDKAKEMNGNAQIIEAIKADDSGIGYVGAGYVNLGRNGSKPPVKVLKIARTKNSRAYSAIDSIAVLNHQYYFQRHLYQYILKKSAATAHLFIDFEKSPAGERIIRSAGYYPPKNHLEK